MRTFLLALGSALTVPIAILNWGAIVVGGIWLAILGQWSLVILGLIVIFAGTWILSLAMAPGLGIGYLAVRVFEKSKIASYPLLALVATYNFVVLCAWCVGFFLFCELRTHGSYWPFILWAYALATIPWVSTYAEEAKTGDAEGSLGWVAAAEFGSLAIMISVMVGHGFQTPFGMLVFFVPVAILAMAMTAFVSHYKRTQRDRVFEKNQREAVQKRTI